LKLKDVVRPREDVLHPERFQSDLRSFRVGKEGEGDKLENRPEKLFEVTYPSPSIERIVERMRQKLQGAIQQGGFLLIGPFGSGKTHALITLYYVFKEPAMGSVWLKGHGIAPLPEGDSNAVILSAQEDQPTYLWETIFAKAGRADLIEQVQDYPTISLLQEFIGDRTLAIFIDEIEDWYDGISRDRERLGRNRGFLQNLMTMADEPGYNLFVFVSLLGKNPDLKELLRRTGPFTEDMVAIGQQENIVLHRFFADRDEGKARQIVRAYLEAYSDYREELNEEEMLRFYPFHPELFVLLQDIYDRRGQGIRDTLITLARLAGDNLALRDLLLVSDLPLSAFNVIYPELYRDCFRDINRCRDEVTNAEPILKTAFVYSLRATPAGATRQEIVRGILRPGMNLNDITLPLEELGDVAYYLKSDGRYLMTTELNIYAIINAEAKRVDDDEARCKIDDLLRHEVFGERVYLRGDLEEIESDKNLNLVVVTHIPSDEEIKQIYGQLKYGNRVILVVPKAFLGDQSIYEQEENLEKAKRLVAEEQLLKGERRDIAEIRDDLEKVMEEDERRLVGKLKDAYGRYVQWTANGKLRKRNVEAKGSVIRNRAIAGVDAVYDQVLEEVRKQDFIEVKRLVDDFYRVHRFPIVKGREDIEEALRELYKDGEIGYKGHRQTYIWERDGSHPLFTEEGLSIARLELLVEEEERVERKPEEVKPEDLIRIERVEEERKKRIAEGKEEVVSILGLTPLELQELAREDVIQAVALEIDNRELPMDKRRLQEILEGLADGVAVRLRLKVVRGD
jgi:hypothetical protein